MASSAHVPAPISGESPTRPRRWPIVPPVEVAAASRPSRVARDRADRPGRPAEIAGGEHARAGASVTSHAGLAQLDAVVGGERARRRAHEQHVAAVARAPRGRPGPGCARPPRTATAPARRPVPSITEASSSTPPSSVSAAPRPALNSGSSSSTTTAASTASSALPPAASTAWPASTAGRRAGAHALQPVRVGGDAARAPVDDDRWLGHLAPDDSEKRTTLVAWRPDAARAPCCSWPALVLAAVVAVLLVTGPLNPFGTDTKDRSQPVLLKSLENLSDYHAATANMQVVVDVEQDARLLPSFIKGERTLFVAAGTVDAAVDFRGLSRDPDAVQGLRRPPRVKLTLPAPKLLEPRLDPDRTRVYDRDRGVLDRVEDAALGPPRRRAAALPARRREAGGGRRRATRSCCRPPSATPARCSRACCAASASRTSRSTSAPRLRRDLTHCD